jgi:hypothetical protein
VVAIAATLTLGLAGCSTALGIQVEPTITVVETGRIPDVVGLVVLDVSSAPQSGTVRIELDYYSKSGKRWQFAGRKATNGPWVDGEPVRLEVRYPCLTGGLSWRLKISWDGATADGTPDSGTQYSPNEDGVTLSC